MSKSQADKLVELTAKGWITIEREDPTKIGGPIRVKSPDSKIWLVLPDGDLKEE